MATNSTTTITQIEIVDNKFTCPILGKEVTGFKHCCSKCKYNVFSEPVDNTIYCEYK